MFSLLLDTNVWLDVAKDERQAPLLGVIDQMVKRKLVMLLVRSIVRDEFQRNRTRISKESAKSLSTHFSLCHSPTKTRLGWFYSRHANAAGDC
jgi:hypothetical protein